MAPCSTASSCFFFSLPSSLLLLCSFAVLHHVPFSSAIDAISANNSLRGNQSSISVGGNFRLGFFTPTGSSSLNFYVGIWYDKISVFTPVWVANRGTPVEDPTASELRISGDGNLVLLLLDNSSIIWSTNVTIPSDSATVAVILDTGNLQLRDESNSSLVFWQSFDHPSETWLPGAKLGFNKLTGKSQQVTAWKSEADPSPGIFTYELDPDGSLQYQLLWNLSRRYWTTGLWDGHTFSLVPELAPQLNRPSPFNFHFFNTTEENYFIYDISDPKITSRFVVDYDSGQIQHLTWIENSQSWMLIWAQPRVNCAVYGLCGPFGKCNDIATSSCDCFRGFRIKSPADWDSGDRSAGCERIAPLKCEQNSTTNSENDGFFQMAYVRLPAEANALAAAMAGSLEDCELACSSNCSCNAYSYNGSGCFVWNGELLNLQEQYYQSDAATIYLRLAASELQSSGSNRKRKTTRVIIGVSVAIFVVCLAMISWITVRNRRRSRKMIGHLNNVQSSLVPFTFCELQHATRNFSEKVGGGGFGSVFKGSLSGSIAIAVKKLEGLRQGEKQFRTEVSTIGRIQHVNLVRLLGFCSQGSNKLLVYEFMPNGSLNAHLFGGAAASTGLSWGTRYQIAIGVAKGLAYLHEKCRECIIHCDIKPENILLDAAFNPKVADFGLAKLVGREFSRVLTTFKGTIGYLAPEWIAGVAITAKADVYSYGMMLFEIISGRRNREKLAATAGVDYFPDLVAIRLTEGDVASVLDGRLAREEANLEELERACKLACWCIQGQESCRPTMGQVVQVLEGITEIDMPPIPRWLLLDARTQNHGSVSSTGIR
ncbi:G-type lectin S-receptor-like serine/threonine-protein kinase At2g19130 [Curcuma longa]|uniref:G-type lectin S-receptor-like serine/threonine-protein kinase At2g19130 n=1 Tax=Curcuma longa TaxID=136217 RepID=UPI003D9DC25A